MSSSKLRIVPATEEHAGLMAAFFRQTWDPAALADDVVRDRQLAAERNPAFPGEPPLAVLALLDDTVVGYLGSIPARFWVNGQVVPGYWAKGLMVLAAHRNGPIGPLLVKEMAKRVNVLGSLAVNPAALRLFEAVGLRSLGALGNRIIPIRMGRIVRRVDRSLLPTGGALGTLVAAATHPAGRPISALAAGAAGGILTWARTRAGRAFQWEIGRTTPVGADDLWRVMRGQIGGGVVRDASYLEWRYGSPSTDGYWYVTVRQDATVVAVGVVRSPRDQGDERLRGIRIAVLSEVLADLTRPAAIRALLVGAESVARSANADALLCSGTHPVLDSALKAHRALALPGNVTFLVRLPSGIPVPDAGAWWLTRGDGDSDDVF